MSKVFYAAGVAILVVGVSAWLLSRSASPSPSEASPSPSPSGNAQFLQEVPEDFLTPPSQEVSRDAAEDDAAVDTTLEATSETAPVDSTTTVTIDESGFTPNEITVLAGGTVTFTNNGQAAHWPASDVHPTHELLPDFDAERGLNTGESYSYTFTQAGTWQFHDHLFPEFSGTVTVETARE